MRLLNQTLAVLPVALFLSPLADELAFRPKDGSEQEKALAVALELQVESMKISLNGQDMGDGGMGEQEGKLAVRYDATVSDTYVKSMDGQPTDLVREFAKLKLVFDPGEGEPENVLSGFEGKAVRFAWDAENKEFKKSFHECEGEEDALAGLDVDMDTLALLPTKAVGKDDAWEATGSGLAQVFFPGGVFVNSEGEVAKNTSELVGELRKHFGAMTVKCLFKEKREQEGVEVGEVALTFEHSGEFDLGSVLEGAIPEMGAESAEIDATAKLKSSGTGTLLWNMASGRLYSLELEAELELVLALTAAIEAQGQSMEVEVSIEASGTGTWKLDAH